MNVLGIETASPVCSVGFVDDKGHVAERNLVDPHIHSEKLLSLVSDVLRQAEVDMRELDVIGVSLGPGSFTGLRIGLSTAKGLCFSLGLKLVGVPTFQAVASAAFTSAHQPAGVVIAVDAKQGEFYWAQATGGTGKNGRELTAAIRTLAEASISDSSNDRSVWITDRPDFARRCGVAQDRILRYADFSRGDAVARLAMECAGLGDFTDLASAEPLYLKDFVVKKATT